MKAEVRIVDIEVVEVRFFDAENDGWGLGPLQNPSLHVLNAHCASEEQDAWKLPQAVTNIELVA